MRASASITAARANGSSSRSRSFSTPNALLSPIRPRARAAAARSRSSPEVSAPRSTPTKSATPYSPSACAHHSFVRATLAVDLSRAATTCRAYGSVNLGITSHTRSRKCGFSPSSTAMRASIASAVPTFRQSRAPWPTVPSLPDARSCFARARSASSEPPASAGGATAAHATSSAVHQAFRPMRRDPIETESRSYTPRSMRVLVLGGHGWIGRALLPALRRRGHTPVAPRHAECDIADPRAVRRALAASRARAVVNAAAANSGERDEALLAAVNVDGARNVAAEAERAGARLVHVSTDLVLDGRSPPYGDDAEARPVNAYGRSKAAGERAVHEACPSAVLVRASHVYDLRTPDPFLAAFAQRLARGEPARLFTDEVRCPIARPALASALAELVTLDVAGT